MVSQVKRAAEEVSRGADEISQGNANLSQRTEAAGLVAGGDRLLDGGDDQHRQAECGQRRPGQPAGASQRATRPTKGGAVVAKAVQAMTEINEASKKIADIIGVIDEIAFQTNLLALNAAVEAARAGEQGRGFAVVATEVRNLAGRSATAAKEIKALIQDSVRKVDEGSNLVTQSGATLEQIVGAVKKVTDIVAEIAAASREQSAGIEQVNKRRHAARRAHAAECRAGGRGLRRQPVDGRAGPRPERFDAAFPCERAPAAPVTAAPVGGADSVRTNERRKGGRPWTSPRNPETSAVPALRTTAAGTDDSIWNEF